jgi:hypothetical protein
MVIPAKAGTQGAEAAALAYDPAMGVTNTSMSQTTFRVGLLIS